MVGRNKELLEKLGRQDLCPCGSGLRFQQMLPEIGQVSMAQIETTFFRA